MKLILLNSKGSTHMQIIAIIFFLSLIFAAGIVFAGTVEFEGQTDVGKIKIPGSVKYDPENNTYRITGSGENMWGTEDAFYYVWKKAEGDLTLKIDVEWIGKGKQLHRKAGWMVRAGLENDDPYVDAVIHGDGLISMQYRTTKGGTTNEVQ